MQQQHKRLRAPPGMNPIPAPPAPWNEVLIQPGRSRKKQAILSSSSSSIGSASISDHLKPQQRKNKNVHFFPDPFFPHARAMRCAGNAAPPAPASCVVQATSASSNGSENWEQQCCARPAACRFRPDLMIEPDIMKNKKEAHHKRLHPTPSEEEQQQQDLADDDDGEEEEQEAEVEEEEDDSSSLTAEAIAAESLLALDVLAHCASVQAQIHDSAASGSTREVFLHGLGFSIFQKRIQRRARSAMANHHQHQPQPQQERPYLLRSKTRTMPIDKNKSKSKSKSSSNNPEDASVASSPIARSQQQQRKRARLMPSKFQDSVLMWNKKKKSSSRRERN